MMVLLQRPFVSEDSNPRLIGTSRPAETPSIPSPPLPTTLPFLSVAFPSNVSSSSPASGSFGCAPLPEPSLTSAFSLFSRRSATSTTCPLCHKFRFCHGPLTAQPFPQLLIQKPLFHLSSSLCSDDAISSDHTGRPTPVPSRVDPGLALLDDRLDFRTFLLRILDYGCWVPSGHSDD